MRTLTATTLAAFLPGAAWSQVCPPGAETGPSVALNTTVQLVAMHPDDSYYAERGDLVGRSGVVEGELYPNGSCWYGGSIRLDNGETRYFYKVAIDGGGVSGAWPDCPADALLDGITRGRSYAVLAIHRDDSYAHSAEIGPGTSVRAEDTMVNNGGCWWGGSVKSPNGNTLYVYKVALGRDVDSCPGGALTGDVHAGEALTVAAVHADARNAMAGRLSEGDAVVAAGALVVDKRCWFSGALQKPDGQIVHASRVALVRGGGGSASCPTNRPAEPLERGQRVTINALHVDDPYASVSDRIVGRSVTLLAPSRPGNGCWHSVDVATDAGVRIALERAVLRSAD